MEIGRNGALNRCRKPTEVWRVCRVKPLPPALAQNLGCTLRPFNRQSLQLLHLRASSSSTTNYELQIPQKLQGIHYWFHTHLFFCMLFIMHAPMPQQDIWWLVLWDKHVTMVAMHLGKFTTSLQLPKLPPCAIVLLNHHHQCLTQ